MSKTISATKKMLAMILAMLMMLSGMAVSASAEGENPIPDFEAIVNDSATTTVPTITVKKFAQINGRDVTVTISPNTNVLESFDKDGNYLYSNLTAGTKYTFTAAYEDADGNKFTKTSTKTLLLKQTAPAAPVPSKVTSSSITVVKVTGCEYKLEKESDSSVVYDWSETVVFDKNLSAYTRYVVSIRKKATDTKYASEAVSITVETLKKADTVNVAPVPTLVDKTDKTVTVVCVDKDGKDVTNVQFSIDRGNTWQASGTFTGLTPNTIYGIIARKTFDAAVQDPNPTSAILEIRTNSRAKYSASVGKCTFTVAEGTIYAEKDIQVTVTGDGPAGSFKNPKTGEYADTQLVPSYVKIGDDTFKLTRSSENVYTGYISPDAAFANQKNVNVEVVYIVKQHNGEQFEATTKTATSNHKIDVGAEWGILTILGEFFTKAANLLLNTIPQFFTDLFGSEEASKFFAGIADMIGNLGKPATK